MHWQGLWSENQTFDREVDCDVDEIRRLLDDDVPDNTYDGTVSPEEEGS